MTDMAVRAENIDEAKAEEARKRAESAWPRNSTTKKRRCAPLPSPLSRQLRLSAPAPQAPLGAPPS